MNKLMLVLLVLVSAGCAHNRGRQVMGCRTYGNKFYAVTKCYEPPNQIQQTETAQE